MIKSTTTLFFLSLSLLLTMSCKNDTTNLTDEITKLQTEIAQLKATPTASTPGFIHTVYFYAAEGLTNKRKTEFIEGLAELAKTPSIQKVYYGPPAGTARAVVDNDYLVAWICHFESSEDHDLYQKDPIHLKFIEDYKDVWSKVLIYDNLLTE